MSILENEIISFLKKRYQPNAIILTGSRARGEAKKLSDWDINIYINRKKRLRGEYLKFKGQYLDISIYPVSFSRKQVIENNYGPLSSAGFRVLYDKSNGELSKAIDRTKKKFEKGSLTIERKAAYKDQYETLQRLIKKIENYEKVDELQYIYSSTFYDFIPQYYFETRNMWAPDPISALNYFKVNDKTFLKLLNHLRKATGENATDFAKRILKHAMN